MGKLNLKKGKHSRRWKKRSRKRMPINMAASIVTTIALYCGTASIFASIRGEYAAASYWILGAIIFDTMDGTVARLTNSVSDFGKELDSLSDIVSFGVAPAVLIYNAFLLEAELANSTPAGGMFAIIFVIFGALRLARYNVFQADRHDVFFGLPIPGAAGTIASFYLFCQEFDLKVAYWILGPMTVFLGLLMVSNVRYPKKNMSVFLLAPRKFFQLMVMVAITIGVVNYAVEYSPPIVLFPLALTYVLFGLTNEIVAFTTRKKPITVPADTISSDSQQ